MKRSAQFRQKFAALREKAEKILAAASPDTGALTAEPQKEYDDLRAQMGVLETSIKREEEHELAERHATPVSRTPADGADRPRVGRVGDGTAADPARGFRNHREFLMAVVDNRGVTLQEQVSDERLRPLAVVDDEGKNKGELAFALPSAFAPVKGPRAAAGSDEQGEYADQYGGFSLVASRLAPRPLIGFEGDPTEGRVEQIPMETPMVEMEAAVDKDHTTSVSGGLTITRRAETAAMAASRQKIEMITLKASGSYGLSFATEELLADSPTSWIARLSNSFDRQWAAFALQEKLRGVGGAERLGVLTALDGSAAGGPTISIAKEAAQGVGSKTIISQNVLKMRAQCWGYGEAIWLANHDTYPQLAVLSIAVGVAGGLVYQQSLTEDRPDMLLGRPIFYTEYASTVGAQGDLILGNWSQFMDGVYQPIQGAESVHVRFLNNERALRFTKRDCGAPSWRTPLTPAKSTSKLSPFIVLDAR